MIKHIFSDMDGTLLNDKGDLSATNQALIQDANIPITLVSARSPRQMAAAIDALQLTAPQVGFNGGLIYRMVDGQPEVIEDRPIADDVVRKILTLVTAQFPQVGISLYDLNNWYVTQVDDGVEHLGKIMPHAPIVRPTAELIADTPTIYKITFTILDYRVMQGVMTLLNEADLPGAAVQASSHVFLDITNETAKKSRGVLFIAKHEQLDLKDTAAFGDGPNDLPMLKLVGMPIVMGNGLDEVKAGAERITDDNEHDGVGNGIHRFILDN
ncbi:hypothetical protein AYR62_12815 [Secundilactobacillus paracollinoides]|uniref:Hydrolase n=1 Tax=Secundilactobacillus paracollinoides TaxID=240427 RepID=A0A1B2IWE2_9LACO|nr:HAD family hydrolase [Secundilactobacillus paracollinoides]ANZ60623.1 hypothetical protein AYR61_04200 [Secundilactobacillus paracollinoides]ANZ64870.1 hypothetical protein AYR62_12815 [Secundilactobacillus paracollinoides]ANZ66386.1 hypothetical protein AYR63_04035 [Secundilactobacillus paracollinoides]